MSNPPIRRSTDQIKVVGFDPSLRNWGIAKGVYVPATDKLDIHELGVIKAVLSEGKQIRQNSLDLEAAAQLAKGAWEAAKGAQAIFVEVPHGSQSARAMASYGICVGVLGALTTGNIPFYQLSAADIKKVTGLKDPTKAQMIEWAMKLHPEAPWPMKTTKGVQSVVESTAEHMADATAAIKAGIISKPFQQVLQFLLNQT